MANHLTRVPLHVRKHAGWGRIDSPLRSKEKFVWVWLDYDYLTASEARDLAEWLNAQANELEAGASGE